MQLSLKEMQNMELDMLILLDNFMTKYRLRYYLIGGSMLGAVRHKGFIPWDDDIDIGMPRKDFERLLTLSKKLPEPLSLKFYRVTYPYIYNFAKVENTKTRLIETSVRHLNIESGVYIDVFPLDGVPEGNFTKKTHLLYIKILFFIRGICCADKAKKRNIIKQMVIILTQKVISLRAVLDKLDKLMSKYDFDECDTIANYAGSWGEREIMKKEYLGNPKLYVFESGKFWGVERPHEYLSSVYGNYLELPPEENRFSHHNYEVEILNNN